MFKSRHTIAFTIIALYFIPIMFLSYYGMSSNPLGKTWSFFSLGLFFALAGSLILFLLMVQFEDKVNSERNESDEEVNPKAPFFEDDVSKNELDEIILNLNKDLDEKKQEIQNLSKENSKLTSSIEDLQKQMGKVQSDKKPVEVKQTKNENFLAEDFQAEALDIKTIEQSLYHNNRVEVTRL